LPGLAFHVALDGEYAYVGAYTSGLRVVSVLDPAHPAEFGYYDTPDEAFGVTVAGGYTYVCDRHSGLQIYQLYWTGVEEAPDRGVQAARLMPTVVHGVLMLGAADSKQDAGSRALLLDASGRKAVILHQGANNVSHLGTGVYFIRQNGVPPGTHACKVVITD
jgi:hypothetical protein